MDANETSVLRERCHQSRLQAKRILDLTPDFPVRRVRFQLARAAASLAAEHHMSLVTLCEAGLCGTAMALLRAVMEQAATTHWLLYAADSEKVRELHELPPGVFVDKPDIPALKIMINELASRTNLPGMAAIRDMLEPNGEGRWLHKFAHGGIAVLKGRDPRGNYTLRLFQVALVLGDLFALIPATVNTVVHSAPELDRYIGERRAELAMELETTLGSEPIREPWQSFPRCTISDPWDEAVAQ